MRVTVDFEVEFNVNNTTLEHLMLNEQTKKITIDIFKENMEKDLLKALPVDSDAVVHITNFEIE